MEQKTKYQTKFKVRKGDEVQILTGKSKGETGKIDKVDFKKNRVYVSGLNIYKRHTRPGGATQEGGIIDKVMPVHVSNVAIVDPKTKKPTRVGYKIENGKKVRFAKGSGTILS
ncbi:MAG: 50S ribosomal protein L24 [Oligoflexales bacterium]